jgi:hypothetical protein
MESYTLAGTSARRYRIVDGQKFQGNNTKKVTHFSNTSAGSLAFEPTELKMPAISRIYARITKKNKV